jgi:putative transcriptional regulator
VLQVVYALPMSSIRYVTTCVKVCGGVGATDVALKLQASRESDSGDNAAMIRFRLRERMADLSFQTNERVTMDSVAEATGIHRATLSKIASGRHYNTSTDNLDALCRFFGCGLDRMAEYVQEPSSGSTQEIEPT